MQEELRLTVVALEQESRVAGASPTGYRRGARVALVVFVVVVVAAVPLYLSRGRDQWFYLDEWDFLAGRDAANLHDLLRPHNEHWSTVPILVYRCMWWLFGLRTYMPYQLMTIGLHLVAACLLRVVMRRAGVRPWIATVAASLFVLLGAGHENIVWAFQIGFVASLVCGLVHLILADHDGRFARRDAIGVVFGGLGLMCSGVGVTMVAVVGLAVLIRRGLKMAALHVAPLAVMFVAWWSVFGRDAYSSPDTSVSSVVRFVGIGIGHTFAELGQVRFVGIALAGMLVVGLVCAVRGDFATPLRARLAAPVGLLGGGVVYLTIAGLGRIAKADIAIRLGVIGSVDDTARAGRYVHILAVLTLPALAVAADALVQRSRVLVPVVAALLALGINGNVAAIEQTGIERFRLGPHDQVLALGQAPFAREVPASTRPLGIAGPEVTMGWVLAGVDAGRIPKRTFSAATLTTVGLQLALAQRQTRTAPVGCMPLDGSVERRLLNGESFGLAHGTIEVVLMHDGVASEPARYVAATPSRMEARAGPLDLHIRPGRDGPSLCT